MTAFLQFLLLSFSHTTPLALAGFGGLLSEAAGVINFALEGMMLAGAFSAVYVSYATGSAWLGLLGGAAAGALVGLLHAVASLLFKVDQIVSSIALNLAAAGVTGVLLNDLFGAYGTSPTVQGLPGLRGLLGSGEGESLFGGFSVAPLAAAGLCLAAWSFFSLHRWGLRVRACGENPSAAAASGLRVLRLRFSAILIGGLLAGTGGACLSVGDLAQFVEQMTAGRGYMAVAAVILGRWRPGGVLLAVFFFGATQALSEWLAVRWDDLPQQVFLVAPYLLCLLLLVLRSSVMKPPSSLGRA